MPHQHPISTQIQTTMSIFHRNTFSTLFAAGLFVLGGILSGCNGADGASGQEAENEAAPDRKVQVETLILEPVGFEDVIELSGSVKASDDATLSAQAAGSVITLAELGDNVRAGQTVAQLDPSIAQAAVEQAEAMVEAAQAQYDLAEDSYNRQEPLYRDSIISAIEFESVRAQFSQAKAQLSQARATQAQAREQLANTRVTTPFAGTVEEKLVERGEQVMPGTPILRIVNTTRVKVTAGVPERYARDIKAGTPVEVSFQAYEGDRRPGRVSFVGSAVNPDNRTFPIEVEMQNPDRTLKPQMVARLFVTREQLENVLVVPRATVMRDENGMGVYVVERRGDTAVASRRNVVTGSSYGGNVVLISGVETGDEVVVVGQNNLTQGDEVQVSRQHEGEAPILESEPLATR